MDPFIFFKCNNLGAFFSFSGVNSFRLFRIVALLQFNQRYEIDFLNEGKNKREKKKILIWIWVRSLDSTLILFHPKIIKACWLGLRYCIEFVCTWLSPMVEINWVIQELSRDFAIGHGTFCYSLWRRSVNFPLNAACPWTWIRCFTHLNGQYNDNERKKANNERNLFFLSSFTLSISGYTLACGRRLFCTPS